MSEASRPKDIPLGHVNLKEINRAEHLTSQYISRSAKQGSTGSEEIMQGIHRRIYTPFCSPSTRDQICGVYKSTDNILLRHTYEVTPAIFIGKEMKNFGNEVDEDIKKIGKVTPENIGDFVDLAAFSHCQLVKHQPFVDGNKRTSRFFVKYLCLKMGVKTFTFGPIHNPRYNNGVKDYNERKDLDLFKLLITNMLITEYSISDKQEDLPYLYRLGKKKATNERSMKEKNSKAYT